MIPINRLRSNKIAIHSTFPFAFFFLSFSFFFNFLVGFGFCFLAFSLSLSLVFFSLVVVVVVVVVVVIVVVDFVVFLSRQWRYRENGPEPSIDLKMVAAIEVVYLNERHGAGQMIVTGPMPNQLDT